MLHALNVSSTENTEIADDDVHRTNERENVIVGDREGVGARQISIAEETGEGRTHRINSQVICLYCTFLFL